MLSGVSHLLAVSPIAKMLKRFLTADQPTTYLIPSQCPTTVEPLNKGHFGANSFVPCREVVPISEVK